MATNEVPRGPISGYVVENVKRLRAERKWSLAELSQEMGKAGRPTLSSGLHRLEQGKRRIDVDDLVALAAAFGVSPITLLLPPVSRGDVALTAELTADAGAAWDWIRAEHPLAVPEDDDGFAEVEFQRRALPFGIRRYPMLTPKQIDELRRDLADADLSQLRRSQLPNPPPPEQVDVIQRVLDDLSQRPRPDAPGDR
jgi:transcriptional regulator with XRE-family HTH domain